MRAALAAAVLVVAPPMLEAFAAPKAMVLRLTGIPLMLGVIAWRFPRGGISRPSTPDLLAIGALLLSIAAAFRAEAPSIAWFGEPQQREGLSTLLGLAGLHVATRAGHRDAADRARTIAVLIASTGLAALWALVEAAGWDPFPAAGTPPYAGVDVRPGSSLGNPILLGVLCAAVLPLGLSRLANRPGSTRWVGPLCAAMAAAIVATLSRGAWLAASAGVGVTAVLLTRRHGGRTAAATLAWAVLPAVLMLLTGYAPAVLARLGEGSAAASSAERAVFASAALRLIAAHPWTGVGPDGFMLLYPSVQSGAAWAGTPAHAHSAVLQFAATSGLPALLLALAAAAVLLTRAIAHERDERCGLLPAGSALVVSALLNPLGHAGAALLAVLSAFVIEPRACTPARPRSAVRWPAAAMLIGLAALLPDALREWGAEQRAVAAHVTLEASLTSPDGRSMHAAAAAADVARALRPHEDAYAILAADAHLAVARIAAAEGGETAATAALASEHAARAAISVRPQRAVPWERLAAALAWQATVAESAARRPLEQAALAGVAECERRAPGDAALRYSAAAHLARAGMQTAARGVLQRALALGEAPGEAHAFAAALALAESDTAAALESLRAARMARWEDPGDPRRAQVERGIERLARRP